MTYRKRSGQRKRAVVDPKRLQALGVSHLWSDVPADVIKDLVVRYAAMGDAILFGTSQSQEVLAVRVYRAGSGASVYSRTVEELDDALGRLEELVPTFARCVPAVPVVNPSKQVESVAVVVADNKSEVVKFDEMDSLATRQELVRLTNRIARNSKRWQEVDIPTK